jgi:hypothetical protein
MCMDVNSNANEFGMNIDPVYENRTPATQHELLSVPTEHLPTVQLNSSRIKWVMEITSSVLRYPSYLQLRFRDIPTIMEEFRKVTSFYFRQLKQEWARARACAVAPHESLLSHNWSSGICSCLYRVSYDVSFLLIILPAAKIALLSSIFKP